jgi:hypothetical protein
MTSSRIAIRLVNATGECTRMTSRTTLSRYGKELSASSEGLSVPIVWSSARKVV